MVLQKIFSFRGEFNRGEYVAYGIVLPMTVIVAGGLLAIKGLQEETLRTIVLGGVILIGFYMMFVAALKRARQTASNTFLVMLLWGLFTPVMMLYLAIAPSKETVEKQSKATRIVMTLLGTILLGGALLWYAMYRQETRAIEDASIAYQAGDYTKTRVLLEPLADKGNATAMNNLGLLYLNGQGVNADYTKAFELFSAAAHHGSSKAMGNLALMYLNGVGVPQDLTKAFYWIKEAAQKGEVTAMNDLGSFYYSGQGTTKDVKKALYWYEKAAEKGLTVAKFNLGVLYYEAEGPEKNVTRSYRLWKEAAKAGNRDAENNLEVLCTQYPDVCQEEEK